MQLRVLLRCPDNYLDRIAQWLMVFKGLRQAVQPFLQNLHFFGSAGGFSVANVILQRLFQPPQTAIS
jgi:hypothetical protein